MKFSFEFGTPWHPPDPSPCLPSEPKPRHPLVQFWGVETPQLQAPGRARISRAPKFWLRGGKAPGRGICAPHARGILRPPAARGSPATPGDATRLRRCQRKGKSLPCRRVASKDAKTGNRREMQPLGQGGEKEPAVAPLCLHPLGTAGARCPGAAAGSDPGRISGWERRLESLPAPPAVPGERLQGSLWLTPVELRGAERFGGGSRDPLGAPSTHGGEMEPWVTPGSVPHPHFGVLG